MYRHVSFLHLKKTFQVVTDKVLKLGFGQTETNFLHPISLRRQGDRVRRNAICQRNKGRSEKCFIQKGRDAIAEAVGLPHE